MSALPLSCQIGSLPMSGSLCPLLDLATSKLNQLFIHLPPIAEGARRPTKILRLSNNGAKFGHRAMPWRTEGEVVIRLATT
ncbi:hypothetical protein G9X64_18340 [Rhizobium sophorae]|uniref:Uncharacterized protein n=1 Tax=Rhizobium sophorae TaxID=1535242 RepID=A0A7Y3S7A1_9HYPH|nr:hypothetical protein [Rhizobium sophorae]NNU38406.1 hypothetical protein [Rhizobium sophorae]